MGNACAQCKARKVKCDGSQSGCLNCERLEFQCSFTHPGADRASLEHEGMTYLGDHTTSRNYTQAGTQRKRAQKACAACHSQKAKCSGDKPTCRRCLFRGFKCEYMPSRRKIYGPAGLSPVSESSPSTVSEGLAARHIGSQKIHANSNRHEEAGANFSIEQTKICFSADEKSNLRRHIDAFFDFVFPIPTFSFLHRALFIQEFNEGSYSLPVLRAVCGAGSVFLAKTDDERKQAVAWIEEAESIVLKAFDVPDLINIQTLLLLTFYHAASRRFPRVLMLLSMAARMAYVSRLNYECDNLPFIVQETRRRLMWAIYMQDRFYSGGLSDFTLCKEGSIHLALPCKEGNFALEISAVTEGLVSESPMSVHPEIGILAYCIRILDIRDRILRYTRSKVIRGCPAIDIQGEVERFDGELSQFAAILPNELRFNERTMILHAQSPSRRTLIMLEVFWQQCHIDLYRIMFLRLRESFSPSSLQRVPEEFIATCRRRCLEHAFQLSRVFKVLNEYSTTDLVVSDSCIAICSYQCVRVLTQIRQAMDITTYPGDDDVVGAMSNCVEALNCLKYIYPSVYKIQDDLRKMVSHYQTEPNEEMDLEANEIEMPESSVPSSSNLQLISQERVMSKYGLLDVVFNDEKNLRPRKDLQSREAQSPVASGTLLGDDQTRENSTQNLGAGFLQASNVRGVDPFYENADAAWIPDLNLSFDPTAYDDMVDPFFRIHQDWSWVEDFGNFVGS